MRTLTIAQLIRDLRDHPEITGFEQLRIDEIDDKPVTDILMTGVQFKELMLVNMPTNMNLAEPLETVHDLLMLLRDFDENTQIRIHMRGNTIIAPQVGVTDGIVYLFGL